MKMNLHRICVFWLVASMPWFALAQTSSTPPVSSVPMVDLTRYAGAWFEIARYPMFFQRKCTGNATAEYTPLSEGALRVHNRCRTADGWDEAHGKATVTENSGNSQLKVSFFWPFKADYWIIGLDPQYQWAVVGHPSRKYLWILSRTPKLPTPLLKAALASARAQGFDLKLLRYTTQSPSPTETSSDISEAPPAPELQKASQ